MTRKPIPHPSFLDELEYLGFSNGEQKWRSSSDKRLYTWDAFHGEIEMYNKRGRHLGVLNNSGVRIKNAVKGRYIDV